MKAAETLSDGLEKLEQIVPGLEWENIDGMSSWASVPEFWWCYRVTLRVDGLKQLRLEWLGNRNDDLGLFPGWDEAKAAAETDYRARIASALNLDPILSEIKRMGEAMSLIAQGSADISDTAIIISPGTGMAASELLSHIRALSTLSPQEPDSK